VKATEPKTRFIAPVVAAFIATHPTEADNDVSKRTGVLENNTNGSKLAGISGLGALGAVAAKASPNAARGLGFYGLAWSVYRNVIARGNEVAFQRNAAIDVRFGARAQSAGSKLSSTGRVK
jgi:hypothetical protein